MTHFGWCYYYTVLAWDDAQLTIRVNDGDTSNHSDNRDATLLPASKATVVLDSYSLAGALPTPRCCPPRGLRLLLGI